MWKILVIDDNDATCDLLAEIFREKAICDIEKSGIDGIKAYLRAVDHCQPYDLIILDIAMPNMDGLEVLNSIRAKEEDAGILLGHGIPVIMMTAHSECFLEAFNKGCDDYVLKPVDADKIMNIAEQKIQLRKNKPFIS